MHENKNMNSNKLIETKDLLFVWRLFLKNIGFIVLLPLLAYGIAYVYTYRLTNIYGAKSELLLKSNETYDYQDPIYKGLGAYGIYMDVQNQIRILNSRDLIGEVIDKLKISTSYYIVGRIKKVEVFETLPFLSEVTVLNENVYEAPIKITILDTEQYQLSYMSGENSLTVVHNFDSDLFLPDFTLNLKRRYFFDQSNLGSLKSSDYELVFHSRNYLISKYQSSLTVENIEHTSVLQLNVQDELAQRAVYYLDTMAHTYVEYSKRIQLEVNENTLDNIQKQIDTLSGLIAEKENELLSFKDQNAILNLTKEEDDFFIEYVSYGKIKRDIEQKKSSINSLLKYLNSTEDTRVLPPSLYIESEDIFLKDAISLVRSKQIEYEIKKTQESESNLGMGNKRKEIALLKNDIKLYLSNLLKALDDELAQTNTYINTYKNDIKKLPKSAQGVMNIQRELDVNNKMYLFLLEKKTNTLIARAGIIPQVRIIEKTVGTGIIYPDKTKMIRLFVLGGLLLAFLIAIIRKVFFERIEGLGQLSEVTNMNILGGIPHVKKLELENYLIVENNPKSHINESFRTVRTNLSFMGDTSTKSRAQKIMLSSFFPGEGKTFCSVNLANLIAKGEKRVLLIDFDLHRPKVHKTYKMKNGIGVTNYIIGKAEFDDIIVRDVFPNLDVITAGPIAPNPSELILRDRVAELFAEAETKYDFVIIDTPPFGLLNDTLELTKYADSFLIILNTKFARKRGVEHIAEMLRKFDNVSKGLVLNGIKESKFQYYYSKYTYKYSYSYNYGYSYGYGSSYTQEEEDSE